MVRLLAHKWTQLLFSQTAVVVAPVALGSIGHSVREDMRSLIGGPYLPSLLPQPTCTLLLQLPCAAPTLQATLHEQEGYLDNAAMDRF